LLQISVDLATTKQIFIGEVTNIAWVEWTFIQVLHWWHNLHIHAQFLCTSADIADSLGNSTAIDTFNVANGGGVKLHWNLDITSAIQTAKANNYTYASFLLYSLTANAIENVPFDSHVYFLAKNGGNGQYDPNIIVTTVVPEPSTYALVLGGILTLLVIRRRRAQA
jgi:hypothetical protein